MHRWIVLLYLISSTLIYVVRTLLWPFFYCGNIVFIGILLSNCYTYSDSKKEFPLIWIMFTSLYNCSLVCLVLPFIYYYTGVNLVKKQVLYLQTFLSCYDGSDGDYSQNRLYMRCHQLSVNIRKATSFYIKPSWS